MEFHILASGSKGNSTFIYDNGVGILIDCGISRRENQCLKLFARVFLILQLL